jgi:hypothetical protein
MHASCQLRPIDTVSRSPFCARARKSRRMANQRGPPTGCRCTSASWRSAESARGTSGWCAAGCFVPNGSACSRGVRRALGGPDDEGRARYQVAVSRCDECGRASIDAGGRREVIDDAVAEMAMCDGQHVGDVDGPRVGAPRATQSIPPAIRRQVMRRDRKRCVVPGCTNHRFVDVHHLDPRSEGGGHDPERLAVLCGSQHRAVHQARLWLDGSGSTGFVVRHAGGAAYGNAPCAPASDAVAQVQNALENMGFKPTKARSLIEAALGAGALDAAALLHEALRLS